MTFCPLEPSGNHVIARLSHEATLQSLHERIGSASHSARLRAQTLAHDHDDGVWNHLRPQDCVDEALMESFPASDPPAFTACHV